MGADGEMQAAVIVDGAIELRSRPAPEPVGHEVRVAVRAAGVNRADLLQRAGRYPAPEGVPADVAGLEFAGTVERLGPRARGWDVGQRVMGLVGGGAHAEFLVTAADQLLAVPEHLDDVTAGATPEVFVTAHDALVSQAGLRSGETVLVHAVGSGVGTAAVQLATALGARVVGTTRSPEKLAPAQALGLADGVVVSDPSDRDAQAALRARFGPVDVVLDLVGGDYVGLDLAVAATGARIVVVGLLAGASTRLNLGQLLAKRAEVRGTVLRSRPAHEKAAVTAAFAHQVLPLLEAGTIAPVVHAVRPLAQAQLAYDQLGGADVVGKVVLTV